MSHSRMAGQRDSASEQGDIEPLLSGYRPPPGTFDEMVDREGRVRAHWQPLLAMLARLGPNELSRRFAAADRHLRDSGVFYRVYGGCIRGRTALAAEPYAAPDRRGGMAGAQGRTRPTRGTARGGAWRCLWPGQSRAP